MRCPRELPERLAQLLPHAWNEGRPSELFWETATRLANLDMADVRVIERPTTLLVCEEWVVELLHDGWQVRAWRGEDDPHYESALELWALPETGPLSENEETEEL